MLGNYKPLKTSQTKLSDSKNQSDKTIGFKISRSGMKIIFLSFAQDMMIFAKANQDSCRVVKNIIDDYCAISGQKVNFHKSAFQTTPKVLNSTKQLIQSTIHITNHIALDKYLGCPIINGRVNRTTFEETVTKTRQQLTKWKANTLSQEGRATLIRSNLAAKPNYIMQNFMLPTKIHKELDQ